MAVVKTAFVLANEIEPLLMDFMIYRDCLELRRKDPEVCWNCPITGSGIPYPKDLCRLTNEEKEKIIDELLDKIWKLINPYVY